MRYYTRYEDGGYPVDIYFRGLKNKTAIKFVFYGPNGKEEFNNCQKFLARVTGHPRGRNWSLKRYFNLNLRMYPEVESTISDLWETTGIDIAAKKDDIAKILFSKFGSEIYANGYDPEEVLQEVYTGIIIRNKGTCPFNPVKSSLGHYIYIICSCILNNYHRKQNRTKAHEKLGISLSHDEDTDAADSVQCVEKEVLWDPRPEIERLLGKDKFTIEVLTNLHEGRSKSEISKRMGVSLTAVNQAILKLRKEAVKVGLTPN